MSSTQEQPLRVVQWATGRIGTSSLRAVIRHPAMELVGVHVHSEDKEGRDAGELAGLDPVGVAATRKIEDIIALQPDCVLHMADRGEIDELCRLLEAGINVVSTCVEFLDPPRMKPELRERAEAACRKGGASIHSTGVSPGFSSEALPLLLTSISRRVDCITIDEFADIPASVPDVQVVKGMRFGREPGEEFDPNVLAHTAHGFVQSVNLVANALHLPLDDMQITGETANARERFLLPQGTPIEKGTVAAQRITIAGMRGGKALIRFRINWYCTTDIDEDWELRESGWRAHVEGDTPVKVDISFPVSKEEYSPAMAGLTAHRAVNAAPYVCAAAPGIRTTADLPNVVARLG